MTPFADWLKQNGLTVCAVTRYDDIEAHTLRRDPPRIVNGKYCIVSLTNTESEAARDCAIRTLINAEEAGPPES